MLKSEAMEDIPLLSEMTEIPQTEYNLYLPKEKAMTVLYDSDDAYSARYRYKTKEKQDEKARYFGYMEMPHKKGANYIRSLLKGLGRTTVSAVPTMARQLSRISADFTYNLTMGFLEGYNSEVTEVVPDLMVDVDRKPEKGDDYYDMLDSYYDNLKQNTERWIDKYVGLQKKDTDNDFMYGLGGGAASVSAALAWSLITKNPFVAILFGLGQTGSVYEELREKNVMPGEAMLYATPAGIAEGVLEKIGLHCLVENLAAKTWMKGAVKSVISEGSQEMMQQTAEEVLLAKFRTDEGMESKVQNVLTAMAYGAILGGVAGTVTRPFAKRFAKNSADVLHNEYDVDKDEAMRLAENAAFGNSKERNEAGKEIQKIIGTAEFKKQGFDEATAESLAEAFVNEAGEVREEILKATAAEIDPETYEGNSPEAGAEFMDAQLKQRNIIAENFDIAEEVKRAALDAGYDEDEAQAAAVLTEKAAIALTDITGQTPKEQWENGGALAFEKETSPSIDELTPVDDNIYYDEDFDYDAEERAAIMEEGSIQDKATIGQVDDDIPFFQKGKINAITAISKIDADRLAFERKNVNPELKGRESEKVEAVKINRFFADRKSSKDISIDDINNALDETVKRNENGVRVLKNSLSGETVSLSNNSIGKMFDTTAIRDNQNIGGILGKECIANIADIFNSSLLVKTTDDTKHGSQNKIRRYANVIESDGETFIVKMTVKELANKRGELTDIEIEGNGGKDLSAYDLKVGRKNTAANSLGYSEVDKSISRNSGNVITIADLMDFVNSYSGKTIKINGIERTVFNSEGRRIFKTEEGLRNFWRWFGNSKVVDEEGRPLVVYHGTLNIFDTFSKEMIGSRFVSDNKGFFFIDKKNIADDYALSEFDVNKKGVVMPVYISAENPLIINAEWAKQNGLGSTVFDREDSISFWDNYQNFVLEETDNNKNDGIIVDDGSSKMVVAFNPEQIKSVDNTGAFSEKTGNVYYQSAFAGSRVDYDKPSLEAIGSGEGAQVHGWGLYYALNREVAEKYRQTFDLDNYFFDEEALEKERQKQERLAGKTKDYGKVELLEDLLAKHDESGLSYFPDEVVDWYKKEIKEKVLNKNYKKTQVHEVDIPENPYLLDEQLPFNSQSDNVKKSLKDMVNKEGLKYEVLQNLDNNYSGRQIYNALSAELGSPKAASEMLKKYGIKGITYDGYQDGQCFVIFDDKDVKVIQKFYQSGISESAKRKAKEVKEALQKIADGAEEATVKNLRDDLEAYGGTNDVTFVYGDEKKGLFHIADKHGGIKTLLKVLDTVVDGKITSFTEKNKTVHLVKNNIEAILSLDENGKKKTWLLTGFDTTVSPDAEREFNATLKATQSKPTFSRQELGAGLNEFSISPNERNIKHLNQGEDEVRGYINISTAGGVIHLLKNADKSTIIHELGHFFVNRYLQAMVKAGRQDELKGVLDWLGVSSTNEMTTEHHERFARGFETYVMEGNAPSGILQRLFEKFRNFLLDVYHDLKEAKVIKPEDINEDVREFFDKMLAMDKAEPVSLENIRGKTSALREVISNAVKGKEVTVDGLGLDDLRDLVKTINRRVPRMPKNLTQRIRAAGGINVKFAKSMDIDRLMGQQDKVGGASGLFVKSGGIDSEDSLVEFLQGLGFIQSGYAETYEDTSEQWQQAMDALENADDLYTAEDEQTIAIRESLLEAAHIAKEAMGDIDFYTLERAVKDLCKNDIAAVNKDTLKYIKEKIKSINKDYQRLIRDSLKNQKTEIKKAQAEVTDFIKGLPLSPASKVKLIGAIKAANSKVAALKVLKEVREKAVNYYETERTKLMWEQINKLIKASKPKKIENQKFDYENNKLFADLREYKAMNKDEALAELAKMQAGRKPEDLEEAEESEKIRMRFLAAKHRGAAASYELLQQVLNDIKTASEAGKQAKSDAEHEEYINREDKRRELLYRLSFSKADKNKASTMAMNAYRRGFGNLWSMLNSLFGKDIADKYAFEVKQTESDTRIWEATEETTRAIKRIFGLKRTGDIMRMFRDMKDEVHVIYDVEGIRTEINRLQIMDIYNAIKNEKTMQDYYEAFKPKEIDELVLALTKEERDFADWLMEKADSYYDRLNEVYIKLYATDLPKVENYWPASSEHRETVDILGEYEGQSSIPSSLKERSKGRVIPIPKNALEKFNKHVAEAEYITNLGLPYMEMKRIFKSRRVKAAIEQHFGNNVYRDLMDLIDTVSLREKFEFMDAVSSKIKGAINNYVLAKIAIAPSVFFKQLISVTNYTEHMDTAKWLTGFAEGLSHPEKTWKYMMDNAPFLKARLAGGYNETVIMALAREKSDFRKVLSGMTRYGDMMAIVYGGYPYLKSLIDSGDTQALEKFEFATLRSQQSGTRSSLSKFQQGTSIAPFFVAFKNTPMQYMRKIVDAFIMKSRGEMTNGEFAKVMFNYALVQPALFAMVGFAYLEAWRAVTGDDDEEDKEIALLQNIMEQIIVNPIAGVPGVSAMMNDAVRMAEGKRPYGIDILLIDDINRSVQKMSKKDKDFFDYLTIISPFIEALSGAPVARPVAAAQDITEAKE